MRVLFLQQQPCIRTRKYAVGLRAASAGVRLGFAYQGRTLDEWYGTGDELFERWWRLGAGDASVEDDLRAVLAEFEPDVIHAHNLPDRLTVLAVELAAGRVPVVHDVHDLQCLRRTPYEDGFPEPADPLVAERAAVEGCTALVAVSPEVLAEVEARYRVPPRRLVFPSYALAGELPAELPAWRPRPGEPPRIVYQGTLSTNGGHYDLRDVFCAVVAGGALLDVYPSRPAPEYEALAAATPGLRCLERLDPRALMEALPAYDFGWAGFNVTLNRAHLDTALPNKVFEYLGCGLPVLTTGHRAIARFLGEHGVGVDLGTLDGTPGRLAGRLAGVDVATLRRRVAATRFDFTVEAGIGPVVDLYKTLVG